MRGGRGEARASWGNAAGTGCGPQLNLTTMNKRTDPSDSMRLKQIVAKLVEPTCLCKACASDCSNGRAAASLPAGGGAWRSSSCCAAAFANSTPADASTGGCCAASGPPAGPPAASPAIAGASGFIGAESRKHAAGGTGSQGLSGCSQVPAAARFRICPLARQTTLAFLLPQLLLTPHSIRRPSTHQGHEHTTGPILARHGRRLAHRWCRHHACRETGKNVPGCFQIAQSNVTHTTVGQLIAAPNMRTHRRR